MNVEEEVQRLKQEIKRLGEVQEDGSYKVYNKISSLNLFLYYYVAMNLHLWNFKLSISSSPLPYTRIIIYAVVYFILIDLDREFVNGILGL